LAGVKIVEIAGLGAAPYGCMMLADMGADVVRIDRLDDGGGGGMPPNSPLGRNRRSVALDLKQAAARDLVLSMVEKADVFVEAFRPGVAERLGLGPGVCLERNERLVYARMTGWGQTGPLATTVGHDLNYIGLSGLLHQIGPPGGKPTVPLNVIGDFGGGGLLLAYGIMCALWESRQSGRGQIVDTAMIDGALSFMAMSFGYRANGQFSDRTGTHMLGGGAPFYDTYETRDGRHLAVAPIEPHFYAAFLKLLDLDTERWRNAGHVSHSRPPDESEWPALKQELAALFKTRTRAEWCALFEGTDCCVTPVLSLGEAAQHPHNRARGSFIEVAGVEQNAPAPRFSRSVPDAPTAPPRTGADLRSVLSDWSIAWSP